MPNVKSAKKRLRQSLEARERNRWYKKTLTTYIKKFEESLEAGNKEKAAEALREVTKRLDHTAQKGVIHENKAARKKSRLMLKFNSKFASA